MTPSGGAEPTLASIPGQRRGRARLEPLSQREHGLYDWILTAFAAGTPPFGSTRTRISVAQLGSWELISTGRLSIGAIPSASIAHIAST